MMRTCGCTQLWTALLLLALVLLITLAWNHQLVHNLVHLYGFHVGRYSSPMDGLMHHPRRLKKSWCLLDINSFTLALCGQNSHVNIQESNLEPSLPRWWFGIFSMFTPTWGRSNLTNIFQMGWNHKPANHVARYCITQTEATGLHLLHWQVVEEPHQCKDLWSGRKCFNFSYFFWDVMLSRLWAWF